jgi:hypothetical protein
LKQVDEDGTFEYSPIVSIDWENQTAITLFPNPTDGQLNVSGVSTGVVQVINSIGAIVKTVNLNDNGFDISELPAGLYWMKIQAEDRQLSTTILKQ